MESLFLGAVEGNNEPLVRELLSSHPSLDVNCTDQEGCSALSSASARGFPGIVSLLLAHPGIRVNQPTQTLLTPFYLSCYAGRTEVVRLLLKDLRVDVNLACNGQTALWWASYHGHLDIVRWWIASGRELDLGDPGSDLTDVVSAARDMRNVEVALLLERYVDDPEETRFRVKLDLADHEELVAEVFALVVFLCDDYLGFKHPGPGRPDGQQRFFNIARRLPIELQMVLCQRLFGSARDHIGSREVEGACKLVVRRYLGESHLERLRKKRARANKFWWLAWFSFLA